MSNNPFDIVGGPSPYEIFGRPLAINGGILTAGPVPWIDVRAKGAVGDGIADDTVAIKAAADAALAAGGGVVFIPTPGGIFNFSSVLPLYSNVHYVIAPGATLKWTGGAGAGAMFSQSTAAGPIVRSGVMGMDGGAGIIDPGGGSLGADIVFDLHSPQFNIFRGLHIKAARTTATKVFKIQTDVANTTGSIDGTQNAHSNNFDHIVVNGCNKVFELTGTSGKVITLNNMTKIDALDCRGIFADHIDFADSNNYAECRANMNADNTRMFKFQTVNCFNNRYPDCACDTFSVKTARFPIEDNATRNRGYIFNNPRAEGGLITGTAVSYMIEAHTVDPDAPTQALELYLRNCFQDGVWQKRKGAIAYSASITPNAQLGEWQTITVTNGTAFTINAPTNPPLANTTQRLVIEIVNSSGGAMGVVTWNGAFVLVGGAFVNPANTKKRFIAFEWNGSAWIEQSRSGADY